MVPALLLIVMLGIPKVGTWSIVTDQSEPSLLVGASYMTFWGTGMNGYDWPSEATVYQPSQGNYSSGDPNTASQQIEAATNHSISLFLLDYGWANDQQQKLMDNAALKGIINASEGAEATKNFSFCIFYFPNNRESPSTINETGLVEDFLRINETYFDHSSYLRLDNRYVVILADFYYYLNASFITYQGATENSSYSAVNDLFHGLKVNYSLYLVPAFWPDYMANATAVLDDARTHWPGLYDAITLWGDNTFLDINESTTYSKYVSKTENYFGEWNATAASYGVDFVPFICPGYTRAINSVYYDMSSEKWWAIVTRDDTANLTLWNEVWESAQEYANSSNNTHHMVLIFTWNDFNEGTSIEPTKEYGSAYLDVIPEFSSAISLPLFIAATLLAATLYKKEHSKQRAH